MTTRSPKSGLLKKTIIAFAAVLVLLLAFTGFSYYQKYFKPNVTGERKYLYIRTGSDFDDVLKTLADSGIVRDMSSFVTAAGGMEYGKKIKPGRYTLQKGMNNRRLVNMLKSGNQEPVKLRFQNLRIKKDFAKFVSTRLEADSAELLKLMNSSEFTDKYGFTTDNVFTLFIPNSYEFYWNTTAEQFFLKMAGEYEKFWNSARRSKADAMGLTPVQVSILASIVDSEALYDDEMPTIAGLYMNRYKKGMKLESDPTVIFANNDFTIHRVLNRHLRVESPYNTYLHTGLPPGPVMMASINAIDAVLNYRKHDYIYMCAKEDFSGYHNFAVTLAQHNANAAKFRRALDERNIKR